MSDRTATAARDWLEHFIDLYAGMDTDSASDPLHSAREAARSALTAGPTADDPLRVALMASEALPDDPRAAALADEWRALQLRIQDDHGDDSGPVDG